MEIVENGIVYRTVNNEIMVVGYDKTQPLPAVLNIPETVQGLRVSCVNSYAFFETPITELILPGTISVIEERAFANCYNLKRVKIRHNEAYKFHPMFFKIKTFVCCENLTEVIGGVKEIIVGRRVFDDCISLKKLDALIREADICAFEGSSLETIHLCNNGFLNPDSLWWADTLKNIIFDGDGHIHESNLFRIKNNQIKIICPSSSNLAELTYEGYDIEII